MPQRLPVPAIALAALLLTPPAGPAAAQGDIAIMEEERIDLDRWDAAGPYGNTWNAESMMEADILSMGGETIGDVQDIIVGPEGRVLALVAEIGGFLDIGDRTLRIPWEGVEVAPGGEALMVPYLEDTLEETGMFAELDEGAYDARGRAWLVTDLLDDYVSLEDAPTFGYVEDLLFAGDRLVAVLVEQEAAFGPVGPYAYPFYGYGYGWDPDSDIYGVPYTVDEVGALEPYEPDLQGDGLWTDLFGDDPVD